MQPEDRKNILFTTNTLPGPDTNIKHLIANTPINMQRQITIDFLIFLTSKDRQLSHTSADEVTRACFIGIPGSSLVKIVYGAGLGVSGIR